MKEEALKERDEMVSCLLEELVKVRQGIAEGEDTIRSLKTKIEELEEDKKTLRETTPDNSVAHLQDELIASKLREAEASLSLKDLKQRVQELSTQWQRQLQVSSHIFIVSFAFVLPFFAKYNTLLQDQLFKLFICNEFKRDKMFFMPLQEQKNENTSDSTSKKLMFWDNSKSNELQKVEEELMTTRIREMETLTELKELRLKVMELETQVQVSTNQLRRQDEENKKLREELDSSLAREKEMANKAREQQHR